jgi:hypothetical protein
LKKEGKELPFKFVVVEVARRAGHDLSVSDFSSESSKRALFADRFGFQIEEKLGYNGTELSNLQRLYTGQRDPQSFQGFLHHANHLVKAVGIVPYVIRMALPDRACLLELGSRAILKYRELATGIEVKVMLKDEDVASIDKSLNPEVERFKPHGVSWVALNYPNWSAIPSSLLEQNEQAVRVEYERVKDSRLSEIRLGSKTTNAALKYAVYMNADVASMQPMSKAAEVGSDVNVFKLGCNWGKGQPDFYDMIRERSLVISVPDYLCSVGDLIVITQGHSVKAIARVTTMPRPVTEVPELEQPFTQSKIEYRESVLVADADWYSLPRDKEFEYKLQQGIVQVREPIRTRIIELWNARDRNATALNTTLNTILYGPPGTGKTYSSASYAVAIIEEIDPKLVIAQCDTAEGRAHVLDRYDAYRKNGRIAMVTFHQSFSYEDFIEGIKPVLGAEDGQVQYELKDGIFKKMCDAALDNILGAAQAVSGLVPFAEAFEQLVEKWEEDPTLKFPMQTAGYEFTVIGFTERSIRFKKASGGEQHTLSKKTLQEIYYDRLTAKPSGVGIYYPGIIAKMKEFSLARTVAVKQEHFVLVIDEINRGNVSGIFGELITLLEPDKRLGAREQLLVKLPYSKEFEFGVPPNLYIVGTMNTADRSVEALDTALRRRFSFVEMPSRPELLKVDGAAVELDRLLTAINDRIERLLDKDHHIGHSYFMDIRTADDLRLVFKNKVLPLLQEYFYGDPRKLGAVLGDKWVEPADKKKVKGLMKGFDLDDAEKDVFKISDPLVVDVSAFTSIYA